MTVPVPRTKRFGQLDFATALSAFHVKAFFPLVPRELEPRNPDNSFVINKTRDPKSGGGAATNVKARIVKIQIFYEVVLLEIFDVVIYLRLVIERNTA